MIFGSVIPGHFPRTLTPNSIQSCSAGKKYSLDISRNTLPPTVSTFPKGSGSMIQAAARHRPAEGVENTMKLFNLILATGLVLAPAAILAQTTNTSTSASGKHDYDINQRKVNQQDRIAQGVKSGQLTAGETSRLEHQESGINREERGMRAEDNGHLTRRDRKTLHAQQNQESKRIYRDKHNEKMR